MTDKPKNEPYSSEGAIDDWIASIDAHFATHHLPIPQRALRGAMLFVQCAVEKVEVGGVGDSKDDYLMKPWFKPIYQAFRRWYRKNYGEAAEHPESRPLIGALLAFGSMFELRIPATLSEIEVPGETSKLIFPIDLQPGENTESWIVSPPNLLNFPDERSNVLGQVEVIGHDLRQISSDLMTAERPDDVSANLLSSILPHLFEAARHLIGEHATAGASCWEAHQAIEQALKFLCRQRNGTHPTTHDLAAINRVVSKDGKQILDAGTLQKIPEPKKIIALRAGETAVTLDEAYAVYRVCLSATARCSTEFKRKLWMKNASVTLRVLPFLKE